MMKWDEKVFSEKNPRSGRAVRRTSDFARRRKNFFPTLLLAILSWLGWFLVLIKIPPESTLLLFTFFFLLFSALFLTSALFFANSRRGLITTLFVILVLVFRYYQIGNPLNLILLLAIFVALEFFFRAR